MNANEEYVRARWNGVESYYPYPGWQSHYYVMIPSLQYGFDGDPDTKPLIWMSKPFWAEAEAWSAARAFTEQREREIAEVSGCVDLLEELIGVAQGSATDVTSVAAKLTSTLKREQAVLAELRRGMKEGSE